MVLTKSLPVSAALLALAAVGLGGCLGTSGTMVQFRDLADIPEKPAVTAREVNDQAASLWRTIELGPRRSSRSAQ
jgi:hypothetical protein